MAHPGRPATKLQITDAERAELHARLRVRKAPEDEKLRMRIVLGCANGESGTVGVVGAACGARNSTVGATVESAR